MKFFFIALMVFMFCGSIMKVHSDTLIPHNSYFYADAIEVIPKNPSDSDTISIRLSGYLADSVCKIDSCGGQVVDFKVIISIFCSKLPYVGLDVVMPCAKEITIGRLKAGYYSINLIGLNFTNNIGDSTQYNFHVLNHTINKVEQTANDKILIYSNPENSVLYMSGLSAKSKILIFDLSGKMIRYKQIINNQIDISNFPNGVYSIKIETADGIIMKKFVKK